MLVSACWLCIIISVTVLIKESEFITVMKYCMQLNKAYRFRPLYFLEVLWVLSAWGNIARPSSQRSLHWCSMHPRSTLSSKTGAGIATFHSRTGPRLHYRYTRHTVHIIMMASLPVRKASIKHRTRWHFIWHLARDSLLLFPSRNITDIYSTISSFGWNMVAPWTFTKWHNCLLAHVTCRKYTFLHAWCWGARI